MGYYYATVDAYIEDLGNNKVNLTYDVSLGEKAKKKNYLLVTRYLKTTS